ncbi:MAG: hypothetical protein AB1651_13970 [Pseudomonadota bacterium]
MMNTFIKSLALSTILFAGVAAARDIETATAVSLPVTSVPQLHSAQLNRDTEALIELQLAQIDARMTAVAKALMPPANKMELAKADAQ